MARELVKIHTDKIPRLIRLSNTQVQLPSGLAPTSLTVTTSVSGVGGLDTGVIAVSTFYYVYLVNGVSLIASTSSISPLGFSVFRKVGAFYTDTSANIFKAYYFAETNTTTLTARVTNTGVVSGENGQQSDWINGNGTVTLTSLFTFTYNSNLVANPMNAVAIIEGVSINARTAMVEINNSTQLGIRVREGGTAAATAFHLVCEKTGVDAIQPDWSL